MNMMGDRVSLNVGGHTFETSMTTMTKDPHSLLAKIAHHDLSTSRSAFIDRDGTHFRFILNFLRDGSCILPPKEHQQQELRREAEYFQVQGLCEVMSVSRASDPIASRPINTSLIPFRREAQEANLIEKLRQKAGPAAIDYVVQALIEAVYAHEPLPAGNRKANILDCMMPNTHHPRGNSMSVFVQQYIDVIKHDLGKLGYTLSNGEASYDCDRRYQVVALGACSFGSTRTTLESVVTEGTHGPALRVSDYS